MASFIAKRFGTAMLNRTGQNRFISTGTSPTFRAAVGVADGMQTHAQTRQLKGDFFPVAVIGGFVLAAGCMALHTGIQQLGRCPDVKVSKKNRETMAEVFDPDFIVGLSNRFVNKSFFRKIGNIQDPKKSSLAEYPYPFTRSREIESLKSMGILR